MGRHTWIPPLTCSFPFFPMTWGGTLPVGGPHSATNSNCANRIVTSCEQLHIGARLLRTTVNTWWKISLIQLGYHHEKSVFDRNRHRVRSRCDGSSSWRVHLTLSGFRSDGLPGLAPPSGSAGRSPR